MCSRKCSGGNAVCVCLYACVCTCVRENVQVAMVAKAGHSTDLAAVFIATTKLMHYTGL